MADFKSDSEREGDEPERTCMQQLAIVERYEQFLGYVYPILLGVPRVHHVARDLAIAACLQQVGLFIEAGKSGVLTKLYAADAGIGILRSHLRFLASWRGHIQWANTHNLSASLGIN